MGPQFPSEVPIFRREVERVNKEHADECFANAIQRAAQVCLDRGAQLLELDHRHAAAECAWCFHAITELKP